MATNLNESSAEQRIVHTDEDCYDMMYWAIKFGVCMDQLLEAVAKGGPLVMNVERHLGAGTAVMAELLAPNPVRHVLHFHGLSGAGHSDRKIVEPDPAAFVVRDDKPGSLESVENDPSRLIKAHKR